MHGGLAARMHRCMLLIHFVQNCFLLFLHSILLLGICILSTGQIYSSFPVSFFLWDTAFRTIEYLRSQSVLPPFLSYLSVYNNSLTHKKLHNNGYQHKKISILILRCTNHFTYPIRIIFYGFWSKEAIKFKFFLSILI